MLHTLWVHSRRWVSAHPDRAATLPIRALLLKIGFALWATGGALVVMVLAV